jgi:hypothetical protein
LGGDVFTGTKEGPSEGHRENLGKRLEDTKGEDGGKEGGTKRPSDFET